MTTFKKVLSALALSLAFCLFAGNLAAQSVQQSGSVTQGHVARWVTSGVIGDGGTSTSGKLNTLGITALGGTPFCIANALDPNPLTRLCMGVSATESYLRLDSFNGASDLPFELIINGSTIPFSPTGAISAPAFIPTGSTVPANGLYLPAANSVGLATNSGERFRIASNGTVTLGGPSSAPSLVVAPVGSSANWLKVFGATAGNYPVLSAEGGDTDVGVYYRTSGTGPHVFTTNGSIVNVQAEIVDVASANRFLKLAGANSGTPSLDTSAGSLSLKSAGAEGLRVGQEGTSTSGTLLFINNLTTPPSSSPSGGGYLYTEGGELLYVSSGGQTTAISGPGGTSTFLRADGQYATPAGGGDVTGPGSSTTGHLAVFADGTGTVISDGGAPATGSVTSVALTAPAEFSVSGSPVTTTGTLAFSKENQTANTVWAGPSSGGAAQPGFRALVPADLPLQSVVGTNTSVSTASTQIPQDNSIPQNTEGTQILTATITPKSATDYLRITVVANLGSDGGGLACALFQDSTANALNAWGFAKSTNNIMYSNTFVHNMTAGTTSATTFNVRCGPDSSATMTVNGASGTRVFGGVATSLITVDEVKP